LIQARSGEIHGIPVVAMCETPFYGYRGVAKRLTDIGFSALILLLLLPLLVLNRPWSSSCLRRPHHFQAAPPTAWMAVRSRFNKLEPCG